MLGTPSFTELPASAPPRSSCDQGSPNLFGRRLLALCQACSLFILNGRVKGDEQGNMTCHTPQGSSLVDYFVSSPAIYDLDPTLCVEAGTSADSDHSMLTLRLALSSIVHDDTVPSHDTAIHPIKLGYNECIVESYRRLFLSSISSHLTTSATCHLPTVLVECISAAAHDSHGVSKPHTCTHTPSHQPWFDAECQTLHSLRKSMSRDHPDFLQIDAQYKRVKGRNRKRHMLQKQQEIAKEACCNAQAFWRRYRRRDSVPCAIPNTQWHTAFKALFGPETPEAGLDRVEYQGQPPGEIPELNKHVSPEEVTAAFQRLKRNKAAGLDGIRAEFLLDAHDILLEPLARTFSHMLAHGVPPEWCQGVIHPIFKAGDANDPNNYRGITVTPVLSKLFAMILEARMSSWAESSNVRAEGQAGFRKDHRTSDNVFIMSTMVANAKKQRRKLYCCFVDFKKAFDSVPRQKLWSVLSNLGIQGDILACLQSMYVQDEACVLSQEGLTDAFKCTIGVKQGCPASPLLFGLYIDEIEAMLKAAAPSIDAPTLGLMTVAILLFADDIALFSYSPQGLQAQLDILQAFCRQRGLTVNIAKTKVLVFEHKRSNSPEFTYEGQVIQQVELFKYLGITFHSTRGLSCAIEHLCNSAKKAIYGLYGRCHELHLHDPKTKCMLFDALVRPILNYCCEIWALTGGQAAMDMMERVHRLSKAIVRSDK